MLQQQVESFGVVPKLSQEELQEAQESNVVLNKDAAVLERLAGVLPQEAGETRGFMPDLPLLILQKVNAHIYQPGEREEKANVLSRASPACLESGGRKTPSQGNPSPRTFLVGCEGHSHHSRAH